ncbi:MAG: HAD family phosphatase [Lachnospiraceae bacterium]|nr:HAD family phosphatase [Lachnospiraceae bacterium]
MIKTIIFDIGGVLKRFEYVKYINSLFNDPDTVDAVYNAIWKSGNWEMLDAGEDADKVLSIMLESGKSYEDEIKLAFDTIGKCMYRQEYAIPWIKSLKSKGYKILYLSNYSKYVMQICPEVLDFLPYMDGGIFSCDVHLMKPDEKIYKMLLDKYDLNASECVFIDDNETNVTAAKKIGMEAIHFTDYLHTQNQLEKILHS